ncbi:acetylneuraminic acid synthetase [Candidatus Methylopumilus universalis]|uniref:N-acetylneuraminate synthase family protein n=1 Tax=Candidatus Methylopumilus universalis TaxID=2588536 RepID=UPI00111FF78A|nr:N-acetylneuraminate synthase family protein [Candidatus Methylopumilus universalis]QDC99124.1 acetylneuraminic acid synthetase [Candidatus Methylopumilus universalis]
MTYLNFLESYTDNYVFVIAEIGVNHEGSIKKAKKMIDLAKSGGADAVKFQTYTANKLASKNSPSYWDLSKEPTKSQYELFKKYDNFTHEDYRELFEYCKYKEIEFSSTPFDIDGVDFLDTLVSFFKVSSSDITNLPLLKAIGQKSKPVILSTGASNLNEVLSAKTILEENGAPNVALLHCILNYPTDFENASLRGINLLKENFIDCLIGYSDHTIPEMDAFTLISSVSIGARIIEKHFTYDKTLPGNDHYHAMDVTDLIILRKNIDKFFSIYNPNFSMEFRASELLSIKNARRSLVTNCKISKGMTITESMLISKRPGTGICPMKLESVIGKKVKIDLSEDHIIQWQDLE